MRKLFAVVVLMMLVWHHAFSLDLNITLNNAGDLINQVDLSKLDEVGSLTIAGDLNGTDILVIRKMVNLQTLDMSNANIVNGGNTYYKDYITSENEIGSYFFKDLVKLESVVLPKSLISICKYAFYDDKSLERIVLNDGLKTIGAYSFYNCENLEDLVFPNSTELIEEWALYGCTSLTTIQFPNSLKRIGKGVCSRCINLLSAQLPNSIITLSAYSFQDCEKLESVNLSSGIKYIESSAFAGCKSLSSINLPNTVEEIGAQAFLNCENLIDVVFPNSVKNISFAAFWGCKRIESVSFGSGLNNIGSEAFNGCESLKYLYIPKNVYWIGSAAFENCHSLSEVEFEDGKSVLTFGSNDYGKPNTFRQSGVEKIYLGRNITSVYYDLGKPYNGISPFCNIERLKDVVISDNVEYIMGSAFKGCGNLLNVSIGKNVKKIENSAFQNCKSLKSISIPENVEEIGNVAFYGCDGLKKVFSLNPTPPENLHAFDEITEKEATLYVPMGCKNIYWLHPCWENFAKIEEIEVNEDVSEKRALALKSYQDGTSIYDSYFYYYKGDGQKAYQTAISKQNDNNKMADDIWYDIGKLKDYVSESNISDDEKTVYQLMLDDMYKDVYVLKKENESGYYINFNYRVEKNYEPFSDYYNRLAQYKERIDAATTNEEFDAVIAEIDADAAGMKDYYLNPIVDDYNEMVRISQRFTEIGEELSKYQLKLNGIAKEIESLVSAIENVVMSDSDVIVVNLRGERMTMKSIQTKALPKGIYIINGKKHVLK